MFHVLFVLFAFAKVSGGFQVFVSNQGFLCLPAFSGREVTGFSGDGGARGHFFGRKFCVEEWFVL